MGPAGRLPLLLTDHKPFFRIFCTSLSRPYRDRVIVTPVCSTYLAYSHGFQAIDSYLMKNAAGRPYWYSHFTDYYRSVVVCVCAYVRAGCVWLFFTVYSPVFFPLCECGWVGARAMCAVLQWLLTVSSSLFVSVGGWVRAMCVAVLHCLLSLSVGVGVCTRCVYACARVLSTRHAHSSACFLLPGVFATLLCVCLLCGQSDRTRETRDLPEGMCG